jgi:hypothetical protein
MIRWLFVALLLFSSRTALAYCCTPAKALEPPVCLPNITFPLTQAWNQRCIPFWVSTQGTLFDGAARSSVLESFNVWGDEDCTDLEFIDAGDTTDTEPGFNRLDAAANKNLVIELRPDQVSLLMRPERLAVTITAFSTETGEILDADILINPNITIEDLDPNNCDRSMSRYDLRNMLVHEIGHVLGFDHPPATETESTMLDGAAACEVKKRDLHQFDRNGLCTNYQRGQPTKTCAPPPNGFDVGKGEDEFRDQCARAQGLEEDGCGCSAVKSEKSAPSLWLALLALIVLRNGKRARSQ